MKKEKFERFCMNCGSKELKMVVTPVKVGVGEFLRNEYKCNDCGFEGIAMEGTEDFIKKYRKAKGKKKVPSNRLLGGRK